MKHAIRLTLLLGAALAAATALRAQPPTIRARVEPDSIQIGDRFTYTIEVDRDLVQVVEFPEFGEDPESGIELVESLPVDTLSREGRRLHLPTRTTYNKEKVLAEMLHDKKAQGGQITVIKVPGLGCWRAETIPVEGLRPLLGVEE